MWDPIPIKKAFYKYSGSGVANSNEIKEGKTILKVGVNSNNGVRSDVINLSPVDWPMSLRMVTYPW